MTSSASADPASDRVAEPGIMLQAYRLLAKAAQPVVPLVLQFRERQGKEDPRRRMERFGDASRVRPTGPLVWFHAASVGETNAILQLIGSVSETRPDLVLLLTTGTVTSARLAESRLDDRVLHQFAPLDLPQYITRFLDYWKPDLAIFAESEIWPNLVLGLFERGVPLALVNARISRRSFSRWRRSPRLSRSLFRHFDLVLAHNEETARQFHALGAPNVRTVGNLKMDSPAPPADADELRRLRAQTAGRPIFLAASTHAGEDLHVMRAHKALQPDCPRLLTVIVPRHPERGAEIAHLARREGCHTARRSAGEAPSDSCDIYIADTIGELGLFFALSPVALIGGSLIRHGGQNPVEAVKHDCAILTGPHYDNFADAYRALIDSGGCWEIGSITELAVALKRLLKSEATRSAMSRDAIRTIAGMSGALPRTLEALEPLLPQPDGTPRAP